MCRRANDCSWVAMIRIIMGDLRTHMSVKYNFQLHRLYHEVEAALTWWSPDETWLPSRLKLNVQDVSVIHFSGTLKMWGRDYTSDETDEEFAERLLENSEPQAYDRWIRCGADNDTYMIYGVSVTEADGRRIMTKNEGEVNVQGLLDVFQNQARQLARTATEQWRKYLFEMLSFCPELEGCASRIGKGMAWPDSPFWPLQPVKFKYRDEHWYDAIVAGVMSNGALIVEISV